MGSRKLLLVLLLLVSGIKIHAQLEDIGLPFINNYFHEEYNAGTQNWSITQDSGGLMYFGNNKGVLQFDGTNWNLYSLPNNSIVRSVNWINNKLYAGGFGEFGYFAADENGILIYNSLSDSLKETDLALGELWRIFSTEYGIVFQSFNNCWNTVLISFEINDAVFLLMPTTDVTCRNTAVIVSSARPGLGFKQWFVTFSLM